MENDERLRKFDRLWVMVHPSKEGGFITIAQMGRNGEPQDMVLVLPQHIRKFAAAVNRFAQIIESTTERDDDNAPDN